MWVSFQATWIHANLRGRWGPLERLLATPRFHHWHHAAEPEARDKNFAVHLPVIDRLFGTLHLPAGRWPERYGIDGSPVPEGWLRPAALAAARAARLSPRAPAAPMRQACGS